MIRIGEFSKLARTTVKALRFYDEIGLFKPLFVDDNGYRYYELTQLVSLQRILELRSFNIPIDEILKIINGGDALKIFKARLDELEDELVRGKNNIDLLKKYIARAEKGDYMKGYQATEITLPKCIVYYRHGVIDSMNNMVQFILEAGAEARENNPTLACMTPEYCFVTYGANEYKETDVELEYAEAVVAFGKESENIKFKKLLEERAISVLHRGPYQALGEAYAFAIKYVTDMGLVIANPIRERYIDGCWNKESEEDYLTEIQIPVK